MEAEIDDLVGQLEQHVGVVTGRGPDHPAQPDRSLRPRMDLFIADHPAVLADGGYVRFLRTYAGAYKEDADATEIIDLLGFGGVSTDIVEMDGPVADEDGFLIFAQCIYSYVSDGALVGSAEYDFAFSTTTDRPRGVYLHHSTLQAPEGQFEFYVETFSQWLRKLVDVRGRFDRP